MIDSGEFDKAKSELSEIVKNDPKDYDAQRLLALCDVNIEHKDITEKVQNTRMELMNERESKKPFIFKGYITEADRINDTIKRNKYLYFCKDYDQILNKKKKINSPEKYNPKTSQNIQPKKIILIQKIRKCYLKVKKLNMKKKKI